MEDEVCERLHRIVEVLLHLSDCFTIPTTAQELILGALTRMYRTADVVARRILISKIQFPRKPFVHLMHHIGARLNESLYQLVIRSKVLLPSVLLLIVPQIHASGAGENSATENL